jgi:hypothetical protein
LMTKMMQLIMKPIEEIDNVQISDLVVDRVGFKDVESALVTLKRYKLSMPPLISVRVLTPHKCLKFPCSKVLIDIEGGL